MASVATRGWRKWVRAGLALTGITGAGAATTVTVSSDTAIVQPAAQQQQSTNPNLTLTINETSFHNAPRSEIIKWIKDHKAEGLAVKNVSTNDAVELIAGLHKQDVLPNLTVNVDVTDTKGFFISNAGAGTEVLSPLTFEQAATLRQAAENGIQSWLTFPTHGSMNGNPVQSTYVTVSSSENGEISARFTSGWQPAESLAQQALEDNWTQLANHPPRGVRPGSIIGVLRNNTTGKGLAITKPLATTVGSHGVKITVTHTPGTGHHSPSGFHLPETGGTLGGTPAQIAANISQAVRAGAVGMEAINVTTPLDIINANSSTPYISSTWTGKDVAAVLQAAQQKGTPILMHAQGRFYSSPNMDSKPAEETINIVFGSDGTITTSFGNNANPSYEEAIHAWADAAKKAAQTPSDGTIHAKASQTYTSTPSPSNGAGDSEPQTCTKKDPLMGVTASGQDVCVSGRIVPSSTPGQQQGNSKGIGG